MKCAELIDTINSVITPIHKEGYIFIGIAVVATFILGWIWGPLGWIGLILTAWCVYFFRDPFRVTPDKEGLLVSPADGVVQMIEQASPPPELEMGEKPLTRVSIFLNVFDVHVNRIPIAGKITKLHYHEGKFLNASLDKASEDNERMSALVKTKDGQDIAFVQIAGLVARRIVCYLQDGQEVATGEKYGIIRFGSRADVYLPEGVTPLVVVGQRAVGGETVFADLTGSEPARTGIIH